MENKEFENKLQSVDLIYDMIRGSHLHGTATETSDVDKMGVFVAPNEEIIGLRQNYIPQFSDEKNDRVYYEVGRFLELLIKSNPTMLESLFASDSCIETKSPVMDMIMAHRNEFLSKEALTAFSNYAFEQIRKAHGYNKLCSYPENMERKQPLHFCYTFNDKQGTMLITDWLKEKGLKQIYCGLNHMQNMDMMHGVFYDWAQHLHMEYPTEEDLLKGFENVSDDEDNLTNDELFFYEFEDNCCHDNFETIWVQLLRYYREVKPKGYHGIVKEDGSSCNIHLDSIIKYDKPICYLSYNKNGFESHCKMYKDWSNWKKLRNETRYKSNFGQGYDAKNMSECIRLLRMSVELAETGEFNVDRSKTGDAQYLLDIKTHKYTYEQLLDEANKLKGKLDELIPLCKLPEHVDEDMVNNLLIKIRKLYAKKD